MLNQLASARGELLSAGDPSGAPMALISRLGDQLTGVLACLVLCVFRWWVGLELLAVWMLVRRPLAAGLRLQAGRVRSAAEPLRRGAGGLRGGGGDRLRGLPPRRLAADARDHAELFALQASAYV